MHYRYFLCADTIRMNIKKVLEWVFWQLVFLWWSIYTVLKSCKIVLKLFLHVCLFNKTCLLKGIRNCLIRNMHWLTNAWYQEYQPRKTFPFQTKEYTLQKHLFIKILIMPWTIGCKISVVFGRKYSTCVTWRLEMSKCAVQLSTIRRTLHFTTKIQLSKFLNIFCKYC